MSGCGGLSRSDPVGCCANGIPLKVSTPEAEEPITVAAWAAMVTVGPEALFAGAARARGKKQKRTEMSIMLAVNEVIRLK